MPDRRAALIAEGIALASVVLTLGVWAWILTRPAGYFHDQGGLTITLICFPVTFVFWLLCGIASNVAVRRLARVGSVPGDAWIRSARQFVTRSLALGLLLSIVTLFIA